MERCYSRHNPSKLSQPPGNHKLNPRQEEENRITWKALAELLMAAGAL